MELIDKRCRCGNLMHNVSPRQQICEECKKRRTPPGGRAAHSRKASHSRASSSVSGKPMPWASATASMWPAGWIRWFEMNTLWATGALLAALMLLVILLSPEQEVPPPRVLPPADTLPDKPIPMEHEHGT